MPKRERVILPGRGKAARRALTQATINYNNNRAMWILQKSHKIMNTKALMFKRDFDLPSTVAGYKGYIPFSGSNISFAYDFVFSHMPNYTDFNPFDRFRVRKLKMTFTPVYSNIPYTNVDSGITTNPTFLSEPILTQVDHNGGSAPTTKDAFYQTGNCKAHKPNRPFTVTWSPRVLSAVYGSGTGYADVTEKSRWIDAAYFSQAQHFRLNVLVPSVAQPYAGYTIDNTIMRFAVRCTAYFEVKDLKS